MFFIWATPPCIQYSRARTTAKTPRDLVGADRIVAKAFEVISWFDGVPFCVENPATGRLPTREVVAGRPFSVVSYCKYISPEEDWPRYKKDTALWHNLNWSPRPPCRRGQRCPHFRDGGHPDHVLKYYKLPKPGIQARRGFSLDQLHASPPQLIKEIVDAAVGGF